LTLELAKCVEKTCLSEGHVVECGMLWNSSSGMLHSWLLISCHQLPVVNLS